MVPLGSQGGSQTAARNFWGNATTPSVRLGSPGAHQTSARTIMGQRYGSYPLGPPRKPRRAPDCSKSHSARMVRILPLRSAWGAQECPRLQPEPFWENATDFCFPPLRIPPPSVRLASLRGSECLAFGTYTQNYVELDCVFSSHP